MPKVDSANKPIRHQTWTATNTNTSTAKIVRHRHWQISKAAVAHSPIGTAAADWLHFVLSQQQLLPKPAAASASAAAAITLGFPYCNRSLSFTYFGFGMGHGFRFGRPPGREEIKIYIAYKAGQLLLLVCQGILLFSMFLSLTLSLRFASIRSFVFLLLPFFARLSSWVGCCQSGKRGCH